MAVNTGLPKENRTKLTSVVAFALSPFLALPLLLSASMYGATGTVTGATATLTDVDRNHGKATLIVVNTGNKDITAFSVSLKAVYASGHEVSSEFMTDYGPVNLAKGAALHSGASDSVHRDWNIVPGDELVSVQADIVAVVYADREAEFIDKDALQRIIDHRESMAIGSQVAADILSRALADAADHPSAKAVSGIQEAVASSKSLDKAFMKGIREQWTRAPSDAVSLGISERAYLTRELNRLRDDAALQASYAAIQRPQ